MGETTKLIHTPLSDPGEIFELQRSHKLHVSLTTVKTRLEKLKRLRESLLAHTDEICKATSEDLGKPATEAVLGELAVVVNEITYVRRHLKRWLEPQSVPAALTAIGTSSYIQYEAKGNVLIMSPWNYPISLPLKPLIYAVAAGCVSIIKPSEYAPGSAKLVAKIVREVFTPDEVAVIEGTAETARELLKLPFNHVFFTGSTAVGKEVMKMASAHLASVTLELGGKSPSIVDVSADIPKTAELIVWGKFYNNGQTCIAPDYVLVQKEIKAELIEALKKAISTMYGTESEGIESLNSYGRIVNTKHFERILSILEDALSKGAKIEYGGTTNIDRLQIEPTILTNINSSMRIMQEEIFGPLLPVLTFENLREVSDFVNDMDKPLALYIHSKRASNIDFLLQNTSSGNALVNEVLTQFGNPEIPFGGINQSGSGKSNGYFGFREFTNAKGVTKRRFGHLRFLYPPYSTKMEELLKKIIRWL